jgi:methylmalonyl-CoA mutase N-terminal domain/subunit
VNGATTARQRAAWQKRNAEAKERRDLYPFTISGIPIKPLYTSEDLAGMDQARDLGYPGEFPYTRGVHTTMYRGRMFTMRQFSGFAGPRESNRRYHSLLAQGQTGLSIAFDNPTIMGYDSDHPKAHGEVGKCGVAVDSLRDMEILLDGIDPRDLDLDDHRGPPPLFGFTRRTPRRRCRSRSCAARSRTTSEGTSRRSAGASRRGSACASSST